MAEIDASIPLGVVGGRHGMMEAGGGGGNALSNPMETVQNVADTIAKLNANKMFAAQFAARQKAGQILASSPDTDSAVKSMIIDPDIQAFAPQVAHDVMTTRNSVLDAAGKTQTQSFDAYGKTLQLLAASVTDPAQVPMIIKNSLALASPEIRGGLAKSLGNVQEALKSAPDPESRLKLLSGLIVSTGSGEMLKHVLRTPASTNIGGQTVFGTVAPGQGGPMGEKPGEFIESNAITNTRSPQLGAQGSVDLPAGSRGGSGGGSNALVPGAPPKPTAAAKAALPSLAEEETSPLGADGKPLFPKNFSALAQTHSPGYVGGKTPQQAQQATSLMENFTKDGHKEYRNAQTALGLLDEMDENFDTMERSGAFTKPGAGADQRIAMGKTANMLASLFNAEPVANPGGVAAAEDLVKGTKRMGANLTNQLFGTQREAAQTIENITKAVPGIENTYLGGKLITALIRASVKRSMDEYEFHNRYQTETKGDLTGADIAFSKEHAMIGYIKPVLESFGMTGEGFKNKAALKDAVAKKWLTEQQALTIAKKQFGGFKEED